MSSTMAVTTADSSELPPIYNKALNHLLQEDTPPLATLPDQEVLSIAKEILQAIYSQQWSEADQWPAQEAALYKLSGSTALNSAAASKFVMCTALMDYVRTFIEGLEYKVLGDKDKEEPPELLKKKRCVGEDVVVYGPVSLSATLPGNTFEVWTSSSDENTGKHTSKQKDKVQSFTTNDTKRVAVVLGAGNQSFLGIIDVLDNTLRHRRPVLLKHHPLRPWLAAPYAIILEPLATRGYFSQCQDVSIQVTKMLLSHPAVKHVHITGAYSTAKAVEEILMQANNSELSSSQVKSMITSELGCATPQIIDDGDYTTKELSHIAQMIACGKKTNCGSNCLSPQVVVLPKSWKQKHLFREKLLQELERQPTTPCYYPGSLEKNRSLVEDCKRFGSKCIIAVAPSVSAETKITEDDHVVVVECGTPGQKGYNSQSLLVEAFGPTLSIVELDDSNNNSSSSSQDDGMYLANVAVPFLNNKENIFGSLSCSIFIPKSKGPSYHESEPFQKVLSALNYGSIAINQMSLFGYTASTKGGIWGGHSLETLGQSGNGNIGDLYGIIGDGDCTAAKVVLYGPSLETKPLLDNSSPPPPVVLDVIRELICTDSIMKGVGKALVLICRRMFYAGISYLPILGRLVGDN
ncbi:hypothetical protein ACHAXN_004443 [Cyclotella atomus]